MKFSNEEIYTRAVSNKGRIEANVALRQLNQIRRGWRPAIALSTRLRTHLHSHCPLLRFLKAWHQFFFRFFCDGGRGGATWRNKKNLDFVFFFVPRDSPLLNAWSNIQIGRPLVYRFCRGVPYFLSVFFFALASPYCVTSLVFKHRL